MNIVRSALIQKGHKVSSDWHARCFCHFLNIAVKIAESVFMNEIAKINDLLKRVKFSSALREQFKTFKIALGANVRNAKLVRLHALELHFYNS